MYASRVDGDLHKILSRSSRLASFLRHKSVTFREMEKDGDQQGRVLEERGFYGLRDESMESLVTK